MNENLLEKLKERSRRMTLNPTKSELAFRNRLEQSNIFYKTQYIIGFYIVDFLVGNTVIEIDGSVHDTEEAKLWDKERNDFILGKGYNLIRIRNEDIFKYDLGKLQKIKNNNKPKTKDDLRKITSSDKKFKKLKWYQQRIVLQRERLYGC